MPSLAPSLLDLQATTGARLIVLCLVVIVSINGLLDACLIAAQAVRVMIVKTVIGGSLRVALLLPLADQGVTGLLLAYAVGALVAALFASRAALGAYATTARWRWPTPSVARPFLRFSLGNYLGAVVGILPMTVVPLMVLKAHGATAAAHFGIAFMLVAFLNFLPSSVAQAYFAHGSRPDSDPAADLRRAIRTSYAVMLPVGAVLVVFAPLLLRIFGPSYEEAATAPLRLLTIAGLATALTYLVDAALNVQHRPLAYGAMNAINAALVVGGVAIAVDSGLTAVALAWLVAQGLSALIGVAILRNPRRIVARPLPQQPFLRDGT